MTTKLRPGLYTIQFVHNQYLGHTSWTSANHAKGSRVFAAGERSPELIQEWRVSVVDGSKNLYTIEAAGLPTQGFWVDDPIRSGNIVTLTNPSKVLMIQYSAEESQGPDAQAFSIMVPVDTVGASFYMDQSLTKDRYPAVVLVSIPVIPNRQPPPTWIFKPILLD